MPDSVAVLPSDPQSTRPRAISNIAGVTGRVEWKDLLAMSPGRALYEATLPLPYLLVSLALAHLALTRNLLWLPAALGVSFFVFLTALRVVHNAFHYALGLPAWATELWMFFAPLLLGWMHAVQVTHLLHHRHPLRDDDVESRSARMPWWQSIMTGPLFPFWVLREAWRRARPYQRRWIVLEVGWNAAALTMRILPPVLRYHILYHAEHHLFPRVPTRRLRQLAARLDLHLGPSELRHVF